MRTKRLVTPDEYAMLAREFPNLVATKNSTDSIERITGLLEKAPELQHFLIEAGYAAGSLLGECGFLISVASMNFRLGKEYFEAGQKQDSNKLRELQEEIKVLIADLISITGDAAYMDGAYDKMFCKIHDPEFPLRLLPPYSGFSDATFQKFLKLVREKHPHWLE
jgi:dihydrodipicolinate synthase/N-acetylneuraminate lyase